MERYVYVLQRGNAWLNRDSLEIVAICSTVEKCLELAKQDGATEEQINDLQANRSCMENDNKEAYLIEVYEFDPARIDDDDN